MDTNLISKDKAKSKSKSEEKIYWFKIRHTQKTKVKHSFNIEPKGKSKDFNSYKSKGKYILILWWKI